MTAETVLVGLPGTLCSPAVFEPMTRALAGEVDVVPFSWLTQPGPWDIPSVAERVAGHLAENWSRPVIVCGHSTGGVIALRLRSGTWKGVSRPVGRVLCLCVLDLGQYTLHLVWPAAEISSVLGACGRFSR